MDGCGFVSSDCYEETPKILRTAHAQTCVQTPIHDQVNCIIVKTTI